MRTEEQEEEEKWISDVCMETQSETGKREKNRISRTHAMQEETKRNRGGENIAFKKGARKGVANTKKRSYSGTRV